jgi:predicted enzyme related to lactoylglutathione lyase
MLQKLRTVVYHCADLATAKKWYAELTGVTPYFDEPFYVGFDIGGCELGLDPDGEDFTAGSHTVAYWSVENIELAVQKATTMHAKIISPIKNVGGTVNVAVVEDPFGNCIGFIAGA